LARSRFADCEAVIVAWIESHQSLLSHHKTRKAARLLGVRPVHLIGHLHALWWWALDYADDGDVSRFDVEDIADAGQWDDDPAAFVDAIVACGPGDAPGFLERTDDGRLLIHDWWDYAGKLVERRRADAERKRSTRHPEPVQWTSSGHPADGAKSPSVTVTNRNRNRNQPTEPTEKKADAAASLKVDVADPHWDTQVDIFGFAPTPKTPEHGRWQKSTGIWRKLNVTPDDMHLAAERYRAEYPDAAFTALAVAGRAEQLLKGHKPNPPPRIEDIK
jgi:hypothetical protein